MNNCYICLLHQGMDDDDFTRSQIKNMSFALYLLKEKSREKLSEDLGLLGTLLGSDF